MTSVTREEFYVRMVMKILPVLLFICLAGCTSKRVISHRNIVYNERSGQRLDTFSPTDEIPKGTVIFVHGGRWRAGNKWQYGFFGKALARRGYSTVVINYRLSKAAGYHGMANDVALSVKWVQDHMSTDNGGAARIFVAGHSAGGHLAALVATDPSYFDSLAVNPVQGVLLVDAFGLDMNRYLSRHPNKRKSVYCRVFTRDSVNWKAASPATYLRDGLPPFLLLVGDKTFNVIKEDNFEFFYNLKEYQPEARLKIIRHRRHAGMILQFRKRNSAVLEPVLEFLEGS